MSKHQGSHVPHNHQAARVVLTCCLALLLAGRAVGQQEAAEAPSAAGRDWSKVILVRQPMRPEGGHLYYDRTTGECFEQRGPFCLFPRGGKPTLRLHFREGLALVWEAGSKWEDGAYRGKIGYIDRTGRVVIPFRYEGADAFHTGRARAKVDGKEGLIDVQGRWVVEPGTYPWLGPFYEGRCAFSRDEKKPRRYGFLDRDGKVAIPPAYRMAQEHMGMRFRGGFCLVQSEKGEHVYIDRDGVSRVRLPRGWRGYFFSEGLVRVWSRDVSETWVDEEVVDPEEIDFPRVLHPAQYGYMNSENEVFIPPRFATAGDFSEGLAPVTAIYDGAFTAWRELVGWANGDERAAPIIIDVDTGTPMDTGEPMEPTGPTRWGFVDKSGNVVIPMVYECAGHFSEGLAPVLKNGLWGYVDRSGRLAIPPRFIWADEFEDGLAEVLLDDGTGKSNGEVAFIDRAGRVVVETEIRRSQF